jgi:hypothetical protein
VRLPAARPAAARPAPVSGALESKEIIECF